MSPEVQRDRELKARIKSGRRAFQVFRDGKVQPNRAQRRREDRARASEGKALFGGGAVLRAARRVVAAAQYRAMGSPEIIPATHRRRRGGEE